MTRKGWRPRGRWEPVVAGFGPDREIAYWGKSIDPLTRLSVRGRVWKVHRRRDTTDAWYVAASGEAVSLAAAKRAAEEALRNGQAPTQP